MRVWCSGRGGTCTAGGLGFESRRPRSHEIHAKNVVDGWMLARGVLHRYKKFHFFLGKNFHFFGFFSVSILPSVGHSAKGFAECPIKDTRQSWLCRHFFWRVLFAECYTRRTICRVFYVFCRVFWALGKFRESGSGYWY